MAIFNPNENASDFQPMRVGSKCNKSIQRISSFHGLNTCDPKRRQIIYNSIQRIQKWHPLGSTISFCFVIYLPIMVSCNPINWKIPGPTRGMNECRGMAATPRTDESDTASYENLTCLKGKPNMCTGTCIVLVENR